MKTGSLRRNAQIALAVIAVLAAAGSGFRYLVRGGSIFADHVVATPSAGPVGLRPTFEFPGFPGGRDVTVYLCASETGGIEDCVSLGKGKAGERLRAKPIPRELPDTTEVAPGTYVLRAGPDDSGAFPARGEFEVVEFTVGAKVKPASLAGVSPSSLRVGEPRRVARGVPCRAPVFLADGRLAVGNSVVDPETNATIEFPDIEAQEIVWSPVGDKLAILTPDRKEIRLAAADGSEPVTRAREARGFLSSLSWSPDGDRLAYIAEPDPSTNQFGEDPTSPTVTILDATKGTKSRAGPGLSVAWSPVDADVLAVEMGGGVIERSTPGGQRKALTEGRKPSWSGDGKFLAVTRTEGSAPRGFLVGVEGGSGVAVTGPGGCAIAFSPTNRAVAVVANAEGNTTLQLRTVSIPGQDDTG